MSEKPSLSSSNILSSRPTPTNPMIHTAATSIQSMAQTSSSSSNLSQISSYQTEKYPSLYRPLENEYSHDRNRHKQKYSVFEFEFIFD